MKKEHIGFDLMVYDSENELLQEERQLMAEAKNARKNAYAPYSKFQVGAAVLMANGEVVIGNNQENASYPSGLCAERVAVFQAGAKYPNEPIRYIAINAASLKYVVKLPAAPCGNCRQSIAEYEQKQESPITILFQGEQGPIYKCNSVSHLLPLGFDNSFLGDS